MLEASVTNTPTDDTRVGGTGAQNATQTRRKQPVVVSADHWYVHIHLNDGTFFKVGYDEDNAKAIAKSLRKQGVNAKAVTEKHRWTRR